MEENLKQNPIDRAKALIESKKTERLTEEESRKQEEDTKLALLFKEIESLDKKLSDLNKERDELSSQKNELGSERKKQTSVMKEGLETLRSDEDTASLLAEDKNKEDLGHKDRRDVVGEVFGEAQEERRLTQKDILKTNKDLDTVESNKRKILTEIEKLIDSPEGQKLIAYKKDEYLKMDQEDKQFFYNKTKAENLLLYREVQELNKFTSEKSEYIQQLKEKLKSSLDEMLSKIQGVYNNAEKSDEYLKKDFGEVDFKKYRENTPDIDNITMSVYSYDSYSLEFPQLNYKKGATSKIYEDQNSVDESIKNTREEIRKRGTGIFSGVKKYEVLLDNLNKKRDFISKIASSVEKHLRDFQQEKFEDVISSDPRNSSELPKLVSGFIQNMRNNKYQLDKIYDIPNFQKEFTIEELFKFAKQNDVPIDWQNAFNEKNDLTSKVKKAENDLKVLIGEEKVRNMRLS